MKRFLKFLGLLCLILLIAIAGWAVWYSTDEKLNPEIGDFFATEPFNPEDNFYVAWAGLYAPTGVKDTYTYGLKVINGETKWNEDNALRFQGDIDQFDCYKYQRPEDDTETAPKTCADDAQILKTYRQNLEFIRRYKTFYLYKNFTQNFHNAEIKAQDIINIHRLFNAYWSLLAKTGKGEEAIQAWIDDTRFLQKVMAGKQGHVEHAIWMVMYSSNLNALPLILENDPGLAFQWSNQLENILKMDMAAPDIWHNVMRGDFLSVLYELNNIKKKSAGHLEHRENTATWKRKGWFALKIIDDNATKNKFYDYTKSVIWLAGQPAKDLDQNEQTLQRQFKAPAWLDMPVLIVFNKNIIGNLVLGGVFKGMTLIRNAHAQNAKSRALILYIRAKSQHIAPENMEDFLAKSDPWMYDPFTDRPFRWDAQEKSLYFFREKDSRIDLYYEAPQS